MQVEPTFGAGRSRLGLGGGWSVRDRAASRMQSQFIRSSDPFRGGVRLLSPKQVVTLKIRLRDRCLIPRERKLKRSLVSGYLPRLVLHARRRRAASRPGQKVHSSQQRNQSAVPSPRGGGLEEARRVCLAGVVSLGVEREREWWGARPQSEPQGSRRDSRGLREGGTVLAHVRISSWDQGIFQTVMSTVLGAGRRQQWFSVSQVLHGNWERLKGDVADSGTLPAPGGSEESRPRGFRRQGWH